AILVMSTPPALGTFLAYGISALLSSAGAGWKTVFYIPAALLTATGAAWFILMGRVKAKSKLPESAPTEKKRFTLTPAFAVTAVLLLFAAISNGFIKDGVTTWTPSILKERYGMKESLSILITVILPLIAIAGSWFSTRLHKKQKNTSVLNGGLFFAETAILFSVMLTAKSAELKSPVLLIVLFSLSAMLMSAVNNIITSIIPLYMREKMESGLLAGVLDTFCYVGSSLSTGLLGYISDKSSWNGVFLCLFIFGAAACAVCAVSAVVSKKEGN
ncbi:MAG: MFS transporter, partial [Eubacterium sp.]|nr:MFS transporter [Eubacterium sp.]